MANFGSKWKQKTREGEQIGKYNLKVIKEFNLIETEEGLVVTNPPVLSMDSVEPN